MPILKQPLNDGRAEAMVVQIPEGTNLQAVRVMLDGRTAASQLWLFEPSTYDIQDDELAGQPIDLDLIRGNLVVLDFTSSSSCLNLILELTLLHGSLVKQGL